jgi:two-component system vancomycin resistance associated response regulator VraR
MVSSDRRYKVIAAIETAMVADAWCAKGGVDLILMDVVMRDGSNGLDAAARIKGSYPDVKIIAVTSMPDPAFLKKARAVGVDSFWYKEVEAEPLLWVMDRTIAGESVWPDEPPEIYLGQASSKDFTERELEVLRLLSEGLTDREIASRLYLSLPAVRYHVGNLISKTGLSSRTELAVRAVSSGLIIPANV